MSFLTDKAESLDLSETEQELIDYIEHNQKAVCHMTLSELSKHTYVSNTSIIRLCSRLQLSGFNELKFQLKQDLLKQNHNVDYQAVIQKPLSQFLDNIEHLNYEDINKVAELLCSDQPIYLLGNGLSLVAAEYFQTILTSLDRNCILINNLELANSVFINLQCPSTIIIVSANGVSHPYGEIMKTAKQRHAVIVLLTSNADYPLKELCDYVLISNDENIDYRGIDINSRLGIITIMQIIIEMIHDKNI